MKTAPVFRLIGLLTGLLVVTECKPTDPAAEALALSIAEVRAFTTPELPSLVRITDAGMEGLFRLDRSDTRSADNTGLILVTANGMRYKREYTGPASAGWFGVLPSDSDVGPELQKALDAVDDLVIPDGEYTQRTTVELRSGRRIRGNPGKVLFILPQTYVSLISLYRPQDIRTPLENVTVDGLSWKLTSQARSLFGPIYIDGPSVSNLTFQNCSSSDLAARDSTNWLTIKIQAGKTGENLIVRNNQVQAKRMGCEIFNHDNYNIYAGKHVTVSGNVFRNCHFGISLSGPLEDLTVDDNHLIDCGLYGIEIAGAARSVRIRNNRFEGVFDKFLAGTNDGNGNGSIVGGMVISGNSTVGLCTGGVILFNGGAVTFTNNRFNMTGMLELAHGTRGGQFTGNTLESRFNKAVICDNSPNNTFSKNVISNQNSSENHATFMVYGSRATNNTLTNNVLIKGPSGNYHAALLGATYQASNNRDETGKPLP
jgi:hypothetical protein